MHWLCSRLDKITFIDFNLTFNYSPSYHLRLFLIILKIEPVVREGFKKKKCGIFHTLGGKGDQTHFHIKKRVSKCIKSPEYSFKSNLFFFHMGGGV